MNPNPALITLGAKVDGANDGESNSGGKKPKKLPLIAKDVERAMQDTKDTLPLVKEALSHPTNLTPTLAAALAARTDRFALAWARTPAPVVTYVEQLEKQCAEQQRELSEQHKITYRVLDQRARSREGGKKGGRPPIDDYVTELIDDERLRGSPLKKALDFNVATKLNPGNPLAEVRKVQRARQKLERRRAK